MSKNLTVIEQKEIGFQDELITAVEGFEGVTGGKVLNEGNHLGKKRPLFSLLQFSKGGE